MGRHTTFTPELAAEICARLSTGEPLAVICRDEHMPAVRTVSDWKREHELFATEALAAQCLEISDDEQHDWLMTKKGVIVNEVAIGRARLQVDTRLKLLAKWYPARYGDKTSMELTGPNGGPLQISETERAARLAAIVAAAQQRAAQPPDEEDPAEGLV